ncbi:MAG: SDR family oxidoreductase [Bdellovibrionales bacterium]|nr:SDR family oxidoreductase [Ramlibacter sp.]
MDELLAGRRVLVIGGSSGIGEATARRAARAGAGVTIAARGASRLEAALARLPAGVTAECMDVEDEAGTAAFFQRQPPWDHVVLAGSATRVGSVRDLPLEDAYAAMQNKFWGAYHVGRNALVAAGGSLTFVSGVYSQRPVVQAVLQGAINAAVESLARGLALELAPRQVRVNTVSPSTTATPLWDRLGPQGREAKFDAMAARLPVARVADPDDIAQAILMVATNRFMTGATVLVDGGDALV